MDRIDSFNNSFRSINLSQLVDLQNIFLAVGLFIFMGIVYRFKALTFYLSFKEIIYNVPSLELKTRRVVQEQSMNLIQIAIFIINIGVLLNFYFSDTYSFQSLIYFTLTVLLFYVYNIVVLSVVCYFFLDNKQNDHNADLNKIIQLVGFLLTVPSALCLLVPHTLRVFILIFSILVFIVGVILLLIVLKKHFLHKPISIFYLILYLCTLEIVPLIWSKHIIENYLLSYTT